jgi:predicted DCC family thiol-disulfide oxidoreductase YuxK
MCNERNSEPNLIVFDAECVFCSSFARFVLKHDRRGLFRFATAQSDTGQSLYVKHGLDNRRFTTNLVFVDGVLSTKLPAFAKVMSRLGWPWRVLAILVIIPPSLSEPLYDFIARNRFRWMGKRDACVLPSREMREKIID